MQQLIILSLSQWNLLKNEIKKMKLRLGID